MPSISTPPDPSNPPPSPSSAGSASLDRMQEEVQALQQQAQATQLSLKKLQAHESVEPNRTIVPDLPGIASIDSTLLGVGSALVLASVVAWWYLWHRPRTQWIDAPPAPKATVGAGAPLSQQGTSRQAPGSTQSPSLAAQEGVLAWDPSTQAGDTTQTYESGDSPFARHRPNAEFDPEAAASEVTRVRKSLAEKREARAQLQERDDATATDLDLDLDLGEPPASNTASPVSQRTSPVEFAPPITGSGQIDSLSDLDLDLDLSPWQQPVAMPAQEPSAPYPADEGISFSLEPDSPGAPADAHPDSEPVPDCEPLLELALDLQPAQEPEPVLDAPMPTPMPYTEPAIDLEPAPKDSDAKGYDFTITLALAQESAALELWNEARDLASEVLESDDPKLVSEALSLLERLNQLELDAPEDSPPLNTIR